MRPIKLIISAFGPYAETMPPIEFDRFEENGLFLICGDTGAGKTTIFDAICFALFGATSGTFRDTKNLRSEYAKDGTESFVDFYFSHQGSEYHILRKPSYIRVNRNGKTVEVAEEVTLYLPDGSCVERTRNVDGTKDNPGAIVQLLNMDLDRFKQIAMIAQGEFRNLLNAKTEKRTEILRTIFRTGKYKSMEFRLKDRRDACRDEGRRLCQSIIQHFGDVAADPEDALYEEYEYLQNLTSGAESIADLERIIEIIEKLIESDVKRLDQIQTELDTEEEKGRAIAAEHATARDNNRFVTLLEELKKEEEYLNSQKAEIEKREDLLKKQKNASRQVYPVYAEWKKGQKDVEDSAKAKAAQEEQLKTARAEAKDTAEAYTKCESEKETATELQRKIEKIKEDGPRYRQRDELTQKRSAMVSLEAKIDSDLLEAAKAEEILSERIRKLKERIAQLESCPEQLAAKKTEADLAEKQLEKVVDLIEKQIPERGKKQDAVKEKQDRYLAARAEYDAAEEVRKGAEKRLEESRAGILASGLEEGEKCPVCGSIHHPQPAQLAADAITEEEYKELQDKTARLLEEKNRTLSAVETETAILAQYEQLLQKAITECLEETGTCRNDATSSSLDDLTELVRTAKEALEQKSIALIEERDSLEKSCAELSGSREKLQKAQEEELESIKKRKEDLIIQKQNNETEMAQATAVLQNLGELGYENWEAAQKEQANLAETVKQIRDKIQAASDRKAAAEQKVTSLESALAVLKSNLEKLIQNEKRQSRQLDLSLQEHGFAGTDEMLSYHISEAEIAASEQIINDYLQKTAANKAQLGRATEDAKGRTLIDVESLRQKMDAQNELIEAVRRRHNQVENRLNINREKHSSILSLRGDYEKAGKDYTISERLYKLVRGDISGNSKITLEQYIQANGFDRIIWAANRRLYPMSDGEFELRRQEDASGKRSNTFLDLEVLDNHTGHWKPVGDLSGGESFKASLSLALGLSDTVASHSGGIQMDALFVDEGFGSLDKGSIERAMEVLMSLSGTSKLVGIISHREELMETIKQQIRVNKTREGSHISIELGD